MNRSEFQERLEKIFESQCIIDPIVTMKAIIENDVEKLNQCRAQFTKAKARIDYYLQEYDNAPDERGREQVIGSVTSNLV